MAVGQLNTEERELSTKQSKPLSSFKPTEPEKGERDTFVLLVSAKQREVLLSVW